MKHLISLRTLLFLSVFICNALTASAETDYYCDFTVNGISYKFITGKANEVAVSYSHYETGRYGGNYSNYTGSISIPSTVTYNSVTYKVTAVTGHAFYEMYDLTSVNLPSTITTIGAYAFADCTKMTYINLPSSLKNIDSGAFDGCIGLTYVSIPNGVETIASYAFRDCQNLRSISIPNSVTNVGQNAFEGTAWYNNTTGMVYVGKVAYKYKGTMSAGTSLVLNSGTSSIAEHAFYGCSGLSSITIPHSVTSIGQYAFFGCTGLATINFTGNITSVGPYAFSATAWLNNQPDGMVYIDKAAYLYKGTMPDNTAIVLKDGTVSVSERAFSSNSLCTGLVSVSFPESLTSIGQCAFSGCRSLTSVVIPQNVSYIGPEAFSGATSLNSITVKREKPISITSTAFPYTSTYDSDEDEYIYSYNLTLYVPTGCSEDYKSTPVWKDFVEIVDMDSEIAELDDAVYISPFTAYVNRDESIEICLKNSQAATAYNFDLVLPDGLTVATDDKGKYIDALSDRHEDHTRTFNNKGNNTYSFATLSGNSEPLTGNDGAIRLVALHVGENVAEGEYAIWIKNASYSKPDGTLITLPDTKVTVTIEDCLLGDVNGNAGVDIGDAVSIVNYLVGKQSMNFVTKAADTNKNGQIDIGDAVTIVNYLVGKTESLSRQAKLEEEDREAE